MEKHAPSPNVLLLPPDQLFRLKQYFLLLIEIERKNSLKKEKQ